MSLSIDTLREEIRERREQILHLHGREASARGAVTEAERALAEARELVESCVAQIDHENRTVEALENAVALLAERLPDESDPVSRARNEAIERARREREEELGRARSKAEPAPEPQPGHTPNASRRPLAVMPKNIPAGSKRHTERGHQRPVPERAIELDLGEVTSTDRERADLVALILADRGAPADHSQLAAEMANLLECSSATASTVVSRALPLLFRLGRIRQAAGEPGAIYGVEWEATPAEVASARLGTDVDNYEGTTSRWPEDSEKPGQGARVTVKTSAFESKR